MNAKSPHGNTITLTDGQLKIIMNSLEAFSRARMGQFDVMVESLFFEKIINWEDRESVNSLMRHIMFGKDHELTKTPNMSYGIYGPECQESGATDAFNMYQVIRRHLALKRSGGKSDPLSNSFDEPLPNTGKEPIPKIS